MAEQEKQEEIYKYLRASGAPQSVVEEYRRTQTFRSAVDNVHDSAVRQKLSCSPAKISSSARSKVAGNMKSQKTAKVTKARADYNRNSIN